MSLGWFANFRKDLLPKLVCILIERSQAYDWRYRTNWDSFNRAGCRFTNFSYTCFYKKVLETIRYKTH